MPVESTEGLTISAGGWPSLDNHAVEIGRQFGCRGEEQQMRRGSHEKGDTNVGRRMIRLGSLLILIPMSFFVVAIGTPTSAAPGAPGYWLN